MISMARLSTLLALSTSLLIAISGCTSTGPAPADRRQMTFVSPLDLPYRYQPIRVPARDKHIFREAADPTVVFFQGRYWLFASHSYGY